MKKAEIFQILKGVYDPEIPVISILDLGIVRDVILENGVTVIITPTYSGCPAMNMIAMNIRIALLQAGIEHITIEHQLSPAWTTDWMTKEGKEQLLAYGIAPPVHKTIDKKYLEEVTVPCPQCQSTDTRLISAFGSTACKALFQCKNCGEPFDYFKCH